MISPVLEELTFGKEGSKFVIKQNIPIDALLEGKTIESEYGIILYNAVVPLNKFPELGFDSWIRNPSVGVVRLTPEFPKRNIALLKDSIDVVVGGGGGAALGYLIGDFPGAVTGAIVGGGCSKIITRWDEINKYLYKKYQKKYGTKRLEIIKGTNLKSDSRGIIPIDDDIILFFGVCHYINRFTSAKERELNIDAVNQIKELLENEIKAVQSQISKIGNVDTSSKEFNELHDINGLLEVFYSVFDCQDLIFLYNKIELNSDYKKAVKSKFASNAMVGDISIKTGKGHNRVKDELVEQVRKAMYKKEFFLENILTIDLEDIIIRKREEIARKFGISLDGRIYLKEDFSIPFYILNKKNGVRFYGYLDANTQEVSITKGRYFNNKEKTIHQI